MRDNIILRGDLKRIFDEGMFGPGMVEFNEDAHPQIFKANRHEPHHVPPDSLTVLFLLLILVESNLNAV